MHARNLRQHSEAALASIRERQYQQIQRECSVVLENLLGDLKRRSELGGCSYIITHPSADALARSNSIFWDRRWDVDPAFVSYKYKWFGKTLWGDFREIRVLAGPCAPLLQACQERGLVLLVRSGGVVCPTSVQFAVAW